MSLCNVTLHNTKENNYLQNSLRIELQINDFDHKSKRSIEQAFYKRIDLDCSESMNTTHAVLRSMKQNA